MAALSSGFAQGIDGPHLFITDPANHRVLNLKGAATTTSSTTTITNTVFALVQQYASPSYFDVIRSLETDPQGVNAHILSVDTKKVEHLVFVSTVADKAC
jgi:hypothetical protein